jgi:hypothetical protein
MIDEASTDDSDYISVEDEGMGSAYPITFSLSSVTDPSSGSSHSVVVRAHAADTMGEVTLTVHLKDGSTSIKSEDFEVQDSAANHTMSLNATQANNISGYNNLTLILTAEDSSMGGLVTNVYQAYFACPDAASSTPIAAIAMNTYKQLGNN